MSDTWIVIPVHNRAAFTRSCLEALAAQSDRDFDVIVVDDGSTDETGAVLSEFDWVTVIKGDGSLWWSGSTNLGVRHALSHGARWVITLNDDTSPPTDFVHRLKRHAYMNPRTLIGALELDVESGEVIYCGERVDWMRARYIAIADDVPLGQRHGLHEVTHFPGRGLIIPREVFEVIGMFDELHFPQAIADYDFTHRALAAGFPIYCAWDTTLSMYPAESGGVLLKNNHSLANYRKHLFSMKGAGNLPRFIVYAWRNCPRRYFLQFVVLGVLRRAGGYLRDWLISVRTLDRK